MKPTTRIGGYLRRVVQLCFLLGGFSLFLSAQTLPDSVLLRVIIIRHGEKPDSGFNLSCKGYNRSRALPKALVGLFGVPDYVYVPDMRMGKTTKSVRMYQTVVPLAVKYDLQINSKFEETDSVPLATDILKKRGTVLVVWDKKNIAPLMHNLGLPEPDPHWPDEDYDSIWILDFKISADGSRKPLFWKSRENIDPSPDCD